MTYVLHIGDKPYSSWSLRGWLLLRAFDLPFEERLHRMYDPAFDAYRASHPVRRQVPAIEWTEGGETIVLWDSLAIAETLAERHPDAGHWPEAPAARAAARALCAEMHCGFAPLRSAAPMNTRRDRALAETPDAVKADVARLSALWAWARGLWGADGPYLFGASFTAADAFFAPVAFRLRGYRIALDDAAKAYVGALLAAPAVAEWTAQAAEDPRFIDHYERI